MTFYLAQQAKPKTLYWNGKSWSPVRSGRLEFNDPILAASVARQQAAALEHPVAVMDAFESSVLTLPGALATGVVRKLP